MRFLIDAQLPRRLAYRLRDQGFDALHTLDLPAGNTTSDAALIALAQQEQRIIVTKDADFVNSFLLYRQPERLLLVSTGNIANIELEKLFVGHLSSMADAFTASEFVELSRSALIIHM